MASAVLISQDVSPRLLVKHVLEMCTIRNVPVLVIPGLKDNLSSQTNISAVAFAIKNNPDSNEVSSSVIQTVQQIYRMYPVPENYIHCYKKGTKEADVSNQNVSNLNESAVQQQDADVNEQSETEVASNEKDVYLYRTCKSQRVFVPDPLPTDDDKVNSNASCFTSRGFVPLTEKTESLKSVSKTNYRSLIVKRLKGNKDRNKRKQEFMKNK